MQVTRGADYAVRLMLRVAELAPERVLLGAAASAERAPHEFLGKVAQQLCRAGLLQSARGTHGGFALARPAAEISLKDVVEAVDGPIRLNWCLVRAGACEWEPVCPVHDVWARAQDQILTLLGGTRLSDLAAERWRRLRTAATDGGATPGTA